MIIEQSAVNYFGHNHQIDKAIGELSELIDALVKYKLGETDSLAVIDEIADVQVMLPQVQIILAEKTGLNIPKLVAKRKQKKLERLTGLIC